MIVRINRYDEEENEVSGSYHYYPYGMVMEGNFYEHQGVEENYQYNDDWTIPIKIGIWLTKCQSKEKELVHQNKVGSQHTSVLGPTIGLTLYRIHEVTE